LIGKFLNTNGCGDCTFPISRYGFRENGDEFWGKIACFGRKLRTGNKD
jgi:hypothetical protein